MIRATFSITTEKFAYSFEPTTQFDERCVGYLTLRFASIWLLATQCLAARRMRTAHVRCFALLRRDRQIFERSQLPSPRQKSWIACRFAPRNDGAAISLSSRASEARPGTHNQRERFCEGWSSSVLLQFNPVVMGPCFRRDDNHFNSAVASSSHSLVALSASCGRTSLATRAW